jgi:polysaccharide pyruvyl transferase WcaK-like protein/glycosyltransferase involved in cell wall biosynthesis
MKYPSVFIIVVCYNEEENITTCLESLIHQSYPQTKYEIIVVDNNSTDRTPFLIKNFQQKFPQIKLFTNPVISIAKSRNIGLKNARYQLTAFIDADCKAPKDWLITLVTALTKLSPKVAAVGGANIAFKNISFFEKALALARTSFLVHHGSVQGKRFLAEAFVSHLPTVNVLYRKKPLIRAGGFDENYGNIAEDLELSERLRNLGYSFMFLPQSFVWHRLETNLLAFLRKVFCYGKGRIWFIRKHPKAFNVTFTFPVLFLIFFTILLISFFTRAELFYTLAPIFFIYLLFLSFTSLILSIRGKNISFFPSIFITFFTSHLVYGLGEAYGSLFWPKPKKLKVAIVTLYHCGNVGDAAIFESAVDILQNKLRLKNLAVLGGSPRGLFERKINLPINQIGKAKLTRQIFDPSHNSEDSFISNLFRFTLTLSNSNLLLFYGGYWLHNYTWYNLPLILSLTALARVLRKKVAFVAIGAGPIRKSWLTRSILNKADYISVRDSFSFKSLAQIGVKGAKLSVDPTFLLAPKRAVAKRNTRLVGLNIAAWFDIKNRWQFGKKDFSSEISRVANFIDKIISQLKVRVVLLPSMFPEDVEVMRRIIRQVERKEKVSLPFTTMPSVALTLTQISKLRTLVSMRLHPLIFAHLLAVPKIAIVYDQKVKSFMESIGEQKNAFSFKEINSQKLFSLLKTKLKKPAKKITKKEITPTSDLNFLIQNS